MRSAPLSTALLVFACVFGCGKPPIEPRLAPGATFATITVTSPAFTSGGRIPVDFTCDGKELMPELVLSAPPEGTKSLVVIVDDPDAPSGVFAHLVAFDIAPQTSKIPGGTELTGVGEAARFGLNDSQVAHYSGPCPPKGEGHRYRFRVIALDTMLNLPEGAPRSRVDEGMDGHILGEGTLVGHFGH
jgi:Raf kinase inhibitor-like YbhB/YbcL family protein